MKLFFLRILIGLIAFSPIVQASEEFPFEFEQDDDVDPTLYDFLNQVETASKNVPGWYSRARMEATVALIINIKPKLCVEVGVFGGASLLPIAMTLKRIKLGHVYAVDSWNNSDCTKYMPDEDPNKDWWSHLPLNDFYTSFVEALKINKVKKKCTIIKGESVRSASKFKDNSIDFLNWDGNLSSLGAQKELQAYLPKIKSGGYILVNNVKWYVLGKFPVQEAIDGLRSSCDIVESIEKDNIVLLRKR